jgi:DNA-binding NarL/FixJ family response regulator
LIRMLVSCDDTFAYERIARHFNDGKNWAVDDEVVATNGVAKAVELPPNIAMFEISETGRLELINCMKSALSHTVVFVVTAHSAIPIESRALACGAEAVISAPWNGIHAV